MNPFRFARRKWHRTLLAFALSGFSGVAFAATPGKAPAGKPAPASSAPKGLPEFADVFPSEIRPAAADLLLSREQERKADALTAFAGALVAEDNYDQDKMLAGYRRALELDPGYAELAVKVAFELARRNDPSAGIQVLKDTIKAAPQEALPYIYLSQLYSKHLHKPELAQKYAEQAVALAPENFATYLALFELYVAAGQPKKAEQVLDRATRIENKDPKFWAQLGDLFTRLYLKEDGSSSPEELKRMNAVYLKAAQLGKDDAAIMGRVGDYFVLSKQVKEAIPYYLASLSLKRGADDPPLNSVRDKLAQTFRVAGQRDEAIAILEQIVKDRPIRFETYELLGELYEEKGELDKALANYEHSLPLDTTEPGNHLRLAQLLIQAKQPERAATLMEAARKKFPDVPSVTYTLAIALSSAKRHGEAMATFAQAQAEAELVREELLNSFFFYSYGAVAEQAGELDKAAELLKHSIQLDPNSPDPYNHLGYMWVDRGEHLDEAGELIKKALELEPNNGAYQDSFGWFLLKKGEPEKALKELLRASENIQREKKQEDAVVLDHIGDTYQNLGNTAEALTYWQRSLAIDPAEKKIEEKIEAAKQKVTSSLAAPAEPVR